jgi:hypothetical protein
MTATRSVSWATSFLVSKVVYDRHEYRQEKGEALHKLAGLVELIINPPASNVVHS